MMSVKNGLLGISKGREISLWNDDLDEEERR